MIALSLLVLACAEPELTPPLAPPRTGVRVELDDREIDAGEPAVLTYTLTMAPGWTVEAPEPAIEGLETALVDEVRADQGDREVLTRTFELSGPDGSYWLPAAEIAFTGPEGQSVPVPAAAVYFDIGVQGPTSEIGGLVLAPEPEPPPWPWILGGAAVAAAILGGVVLWRRRPVKVAPPPPPIPADVEALETWARARRDLSGDDHALALALSALFRRFLERALEIPAPRMTRAELLARLHRDHRTIHLQADCKRLIDATDLIKFARVGGGSALFDELDGSLKRVVAALRPAVVEEERP